MIGAYIYGKKDGVDFSIEAFYQMPKNVRTSLFWRSMYGYGSVICTLAAIQMMPVSTAVALMMTTVFVTAIMAYIFAGESLSRYEVLCICFGFLGVLLLTNPTILEGSNNMALLKIRM